MDDQDPPYDDGYDSSSTPPPPSAVPAQQPPSATTDPTNANATSTTKHSEFLDLTDGEGGERPGGGGGGGVDFGGGAVGTGADMMYDDDYDDDDDDGYGGGTGTDGNHNGGMSSSGGDLVGGKGDPSTPGRVVETGQEHTGRWTKEEHEAFLSALKMYGKEWKKVAAKVKTRTVVQTRTHAQKYFQKLAKAMEGKEDVTQVEMGTASDARKAGSSHKKKQRVTPPPGKVSRTASVQSAAQVISNLSHTNAIPPLGSSSPPLAHGFQTTVASAAPASTSPDHGLFQTTHGFSSPFAPPTSAFSSSFGAAAASLTDQNTRSTIGTSSFPMKIVAPEHDSAMRRGKFPEPSPAACGKRKLAEIAAARMLAGVAASETLLPPPPSGGKPQPGTYLHLDNIEDGTATPPPEEESLVTRKIPPPPGVGAEGPPAAAQPKKPMGLSLQIVNPETLGVSHEEIERRRKGGQTSPVTPWEGQLQALVR
jgi:SHAQKYF class myb-like DNA-binding protein